MRQSTQAPQGKPVIIPSIGTGKETTYALFRRFIEELVDNLSQVERPWLVTALRLKYVYSVATTRASFTAEEIAKAVGKSKESVRKETVDLAKRVCTEMISNGSAVYGMAASDSLRKAYYDFKGGLGRIVRLEALKDRYGYGDDVRTLRFFLDGSGYSISEQKDLIPICFESASYSSTGIKSIDTAVKAIYRNHPAPLLEDELLLLLKGKKKDVSLEMMEDYLKAFDDLYEFIPSGKTMLIGMKWERLSSVSNRIVRILYDDRVKSGPGSSMSREDIISEYNRLARIHMLEELSENDFQVQQDEHIEMRGNGKYRYRQTQKRTVKLDLKKELESFIQKRDGMATYESIKQHIEALGLGYGDSTLKRYMKEIGCYGARALDPSDKRLYYIREDCAEKYSNHYKKAREESSVPSSRVRNAYPEIVELAAKNLYSSPGYTMTKKDLADSVKHLWGNKAVTNLYKVFKDNPNLFISNGDGRGSTYSLNVEEYKKLYL